MKLIEMNVQSKYLYTCKANTYNRTIVKKGF